MVKVIGINRNIMECKERTVTGNNRAVLCINRNIMECKAALPAIEAVTDEPY